MVAGATENPPPTLPMSDSPEPANDEWDDLVELGRYPRLALAQEHGLVVLAMRLPCWVAKDAATDAFTLHAEPDSAAAISRELIAYDHEQEVPNHLPQIGEEVFRFPPGWGVYLLWMTALIAVFLWQIRDPSITDLGASSSRRLIEDHQWWRPFTALFLHGDLPHLLGNLVSGLFFGTLVAKSLGPLRGWALILACGMLGNILTSAITYPESFVSIGASTAVFGALGILSGLGFSTMLRVRLRLPWAKVTAPLVAGVILLGWMGGGAPGGNTDVLGHIFGFASGITAGLVIGHLSRESTATLASIEAPPEQHSA
jgi:rhomboid protease GluP